MTEHRAEFSNLRVGATVTLRDWRGDSITGVAYLTPMYGWLMRTRLGSVFPVTPRELIAVKDGAREILARLKAGDRVTFADWNADKVTGIAQQNHSGIWECKTPDGARWLLESYRIITIEEPA